MGNLVDILSAYAPHLVVLQAAGGSVASLWLYGRNRQLAQSKRELQLENKRLGNVLRATDAGAWEWSVHDGVLTVNPRWIEVLATTREEMGPLSIDTWFHRIHNDDRANSRELIRKCMNRESEYFKSELRIRCGNGEWIWVLVSGRVVEWANDAKAARMAGTMSDISQRKYSEQRDWHRSRVLQMLATDTPLDNVLDSIARDIGQVDERMMCSISMSDPDGLLPWVTAAPDLPAFFVHTLDTFARSQRRYIGVAASTEPVLANDITTHLAWAPFADIAVRAGLRSCWAQPIVSASGALLGTFCIYHRTPCSPTPAQLQWLEDEARLTALAIEKSTSATRQKLAANVFTHAREGISITDPNGNIIDVNETFTHITGYQRHDAIGKNSRLLKSGEHGAEFYEDMWEQLTHRGHWSGEIWNKRRSGEVYAQMTTISAVLDAAGVATNYVVLFTDITSIKDHQKQLEHIAHYDALTGLPNRVLLADRLRQGIVQCQRHSRSMAVAYLDLDGFKAVNDTHGHNYGDELLIAVSRRMRAAMREGDTLARIGGDEFVAVMVELEMHQDSASVLQRLLIAASDPVAVDGKVLNVSASIGVTLYPNDLSDADMLMRHADQAMYSAKQAGKNRVHYFDVAHDAALQSHQESLVQLRAAIDHCQFALFYQPKVNLRTSEVVGFEALLRWQHPERGLLSPAEFLADLDSDPMSIEVGEWVIKSALNQLSVWQAIGLKVPVSVNVGALQLQQANFLDRVRSLLQASPEVSPALLEFEILETSALGEVAAVSEVIHQCLAIGIRFALDDFGTGYSSLTYLKHLPAATLKIDQSFIRDMLSDTDDMAIVKSIVGLTSAFNREVIAEGVETADHCDALLALGCELAQGYGIACPMPAESIPTWVARWREQGSSIRGRTRLRPTLVAGTAN